MLRKREREKVRGREREKEGEGGMEGERRRVGEERGREGRVEGGGKRTLSFMLVYLDVRTDTHMSTDYTHLWTVQTCRRCHREQKNAFCMPPLHPTQSPHSCIY